MEAIDLSSYPPTPVTWAYTALDTACQPLGCGDWREYLPPHWTQRGAWLAGEFQLVQPVGDLMPSLLTYEEYLKGNNGSIGWESLYKFTFETTSTSLADLTSPSAICVLALLVCILRRIKGVLLPWFSSLGRRAAIVTHGKEWLEHSNNQIRIVKFGEYVFRLLFHCLISIAGIIYFWDKEWWSAGGTKSLWLEYPRQPISPGMTWYYLLQSAYNIDAMLSLLELSFVLKLDGRGKTWQFPGIRVAWSPTLRGDFREMFVHHIVTNLLIIGSSFFRLTRVGSMVFLVHDISDVPVDLSKLANFLKWKKTTSVCFFTMCCLWMITRLSILPFFIYKSVLYESWMVCKSGVIHPLYYVLYQPIFVFLMGLLIVLHLAWFTMFLQMGWFLIFKGEAHDLSEHKSGESQNGYNEKQKRH
jgi:hypothetical protein